MGKFKIRASSAGKLMGARGLGKTGLAVAELWVKENLYKRQQRIESKYFDKGHITEDESIEFIGRHLGLGLLMKNEKSAEDDYFTGTCDVLLPELIIDAKNPWDPFSFPLLDDELNPDYYWQGQVYMHLYGRQKYMVAYTLMNTPENLIEKEAYWYAKNKGFDADDEDIINRFYRELTYDDLPAALRIRVHEFDYNAEDIERLKKRVDECRSWIADSLSKSKLDKSLYQHLI